MPLPGYCVILTKHAVLTQNMETYITLTFISVLSFTCIKANYVPHTESVNTRPRANAGLLLAQRRRQWAYIKPALGQYLVFTRVMVQTHAKRKRRWFNIGLLLGQRHRQ